jgi:hypothetical protein
MPEDSGTESELLPCVVEYLGSLGSTPDELAQHYPHTYQAFAAMKTCDAIDVLNEIGAALALDNPKGDHHKGADTGEDKTDAAASEKLNKYLNDIH